jgi:hypothetical protein
MSEDSDKRAPRTFEPPPWERDAFEELARKREAQEAAARELAEVEAQLQAAQAIKAQAAAAAKGSDEDPIVVQARLLAAAELAKEQGPAANATAAAGGGGAGPATVTGPTVGAGTGDAVAAGEAPAEDGAAAAAPKIDERKVAQMIAVLGVQEPKYRGAGILGLIAGIVLGVLGVSMIAVSVWWQTTGPRTGAAPAQLVIQSILVGGFGLGFTVLGGLIGYQSTRQARS